MARRTEPKEIPAIPAEPPQFSPLAAGLAEKVRRANELRRKEEQAAAGERVRGPKP